MERNLMLLQPRPFTNTFFKLKEVTISIIQGLVITAGLLFVYQYCVATNCSESATRTVVFLTLISSNIFLTLTNRSFYYSIFTTLKYKNNLVLMIISVTILITASLLFVPLFAAFFQFERVSGFQIGLSILVGLVSVLWIEIYKGFKRRKVQF
jgi:Ca2+-transporting ATPase